MKQIRSYSTSTILILVAGAVVLYWFRSHNTTSRPADVFQQASVSSSLRPTPALVPDAPLRSELVASAPKTRKENPLASMLQPFATNICGADCERALRAMAAQIDLGKLEEALALGDVVLPEIPRRFWRHNLLTRLAEAGSDSALKALSYAKALAPEYERQAALLTVLSKRAPIDPFQAWEWYQDNRSSLEETTLAVDIPQQLALRDPEKAKRLGESGSPGPERDQTLAGLAFGLAQRNFQEAVQWTKTLPLENQQQILLGMASQWVLQDFPAAAAYAATLPEGEARNEFAATLAKYGAQTRLTETVDWLKGLPEGGARDLALVELTGQWAKQSLADSVDFINKLPAGPTRDNAVLGIVGEIANEKPALMAEWLKDFPEGDLRRNGLGKLAERWATSEPLKAAEWAARLPAGQATPEIYGAVAQGLFASAPEAAVKWLQSIGDTGARQNALTEILSRHENAGQVVESLAPDLRKLIPSN